MKNKSIIHKKIAGNLLLILLSFSYCKAQVIIYNENFGPSQGIFPAGWTTTGVTGLTGWNVVTTNPSSGYTGASGGANILTGSTAGTMTLTYSNNLSTIGLSNISVLWGANRTTNQNSPTFEWSSDSITWNSVSFSDVGANSTWTLVNGGVRIVLPAGAAGCSNLRFRWTISVNVSSEYCMDDFTVTGSCTSSITAVLINPAIDTLCIGNSSTLSISGGSLGAGAAWYWYSGSCGGTFVATGTTIIVSPSLTINYYCRAENNCNTTLCKSSYVIVHIYPPVPSITPSSSTTFCQGDSVILSSTTGFNIGYQWFVNSNTINYATSPSITVSTSGIYSIFAEYGYGYSFNCGVFSTTVTVSVLPLPVATITPQSATTFCQDDSVVLISSQGSGYSYQWMKNGSNLSGFASPSFTAKSTGYYFVNITNAASCSATSTPVFILVNPLPNAVITALSPTTFCPGDSALLDASLGSLYSYQWFNNSQLLPGDTNHWFTAHTPGNYSVYVHDLSCGDTSLTTTISTFSVSSAPDSIIASPQQICLGSSATLSLSGGATGYGAGWHWYSGSCGGVPEGTGISISITPGATTGYFARAEGTCNTTNCVSAAILVNTGSVSASSSSATPQMICQGSSSTLSSSGGILGTGAVWNWYSGSCGGTFVGTGSVLEIYPTISATYYIRAEDICNYSKCISTDIIVDSLSTYPSAIISSLICNGSPASLNVSGGSLSTGANWFWYAGSCGGAFEGSGITLNFIPSAINEYFVRAEGFCNTTQCLSIFITVDTASAGALFLTSIPQVICPGNPVTLSIYGGFPGTDANWYWYSGSCGGIYEGTGTSLNFTLTTISVYYARAEGICNSTPCASIDIIPETISVAADSIINHQAYICAGTSVTLGISGGSSGNGAAWYWYSGYCGGTPAGTGMIIIINPVSTDNYFARAEGICNTTLCVSTSVVILPMSTVADSAFSSPPFICPGNSSSLICTGGSLGPGAGWIWYSGTCGGVRIGTGNILVVTPPVSSTYFLRAEGTCNTTSCVSTSVGLNSSSVAPDSLTSTGANICTGSVATLLIAGGSQGTNSTWNWYSSSCGSTVIGTGISINVSPFASTTYFANASGTCNTTSCKSILVSVLMNSSPADSASVIPDSICSGSSVALHMFGGSPGTLAAWYWYSGSCGGSLEGSGTSIVLFSPTTTNFFIRAEGVCNTTICRSITVHVRTVSTLCTPVPVINPLCIGSTDVIHVSGGSLGTDANWYWYVGSCGGTAVNTGNSFNTVPTISTVYYIRAIGTCNTTLCASCTIAVDSLPDLNGGISGLTTVYQGFETYSVAYVPGMTYTWTAPSGWTGSSITNSITYYCNSSGWITLTPSNTCGTGNVLSLYVVVIPLDIRVAGDSIGFSVQNYPNPSCNFTWFEFNLPEPMYVRIDLYDATGQYITSITTGFFREGQYEIEFDVSKMPSGIYPVKFNLSSKVRFFMKTKLLFIAR